MNDQQFLNFLGLAMRAGKVKTGESVIITEVKKRRLKLVLIASDASERSKNTIINKCNSYQTPYRIVSNRNDLGDALGKGARVNVGITDQGFSKKLMSMIDE